MPHYGSTTTIYVITVVLEVISAWFPKGILKNMRRISFRFVWSTSSEKRGTPLGKMTKVSSF